MKVAQLELPLTKLNKEIKMAEQVRRTRVKKDVDLGEVIEDQVEKSVVSGNFMDKIWKPLFAICYMLICLFDFIIGPVVYNVLQFLNPGQHLDMWQAVTLQGGGLFHMSAGAILGIAAFNKDKKD